jgi:outer membrane murein-binding lipoprotein Lpp
MRDRTARLAAAACVGAVALASLVAGGCSKGGRVDGYRLNPTPNVDTLSESPDEIANKTTATFDTNFRALTEDTARALFLDRPSRLTPKPVPR